MPWQAGLADLGLRLADAKRLTAAIQAEIDEPIRKSVCEA